LSTVWIPHEVVKANVINGVSMIRAWREYVGMTQQELARRAGMTQPALARLEKSDSKPRIGTLIKNFTGCQVLFIFKRLPLNAFYDRYRALKCILPEEI